MTEGKAIIHTEGVPHQKTDMQNKRGPPEIEITLIIAGQTMNVQKEGVLMTAAWNQEAGTEKNAEKETEIWIGKGLGNLHPLGEEARSHQQARLLLRMNLQPRRRRRSRTLCSLALGAPISLLQSFG